MSKFSKIFVKKILSKKGNHVFGIFILKIVKFRQKFAVETLSENGPSNKQFHEAILRGSRTEIYKNHINFYNKCHI